MHPRFPSSLLHAALLAALVPAAHAGEFVYQGQLDDRGQPANGRFDLRIAAYGDEKSADGLMAPLEFPAVEVKDGRFELRFDAPLAGDREAWLEVAVRDAGSSAYASLPGRSKAISAPLIGACWSVTGDSGSNPATHFLGTTDAQPLVLRTGNVQSLRIEPSSILSGGLPITANVIAGSGSNYIAAGVRGATIGGGGVPMGGSDPDFLNDFPNYVGDHYGTVGGGFGNKAGDFQGTVGDRAFATVAGGYLNTAELHGSVGGGDFNNATGDGATVGGGIQNTASHAGSTVPGGTYNCAGGATSFAAGKRAIVRVGSSSGYAGAGCNGAAASGDADGDESTFVWGDSQEADFVSTGPNQFLIRAKGGMGLNGAPINDSVEFTMVADSDGTNYVNLFLRQRDFNAGMLVSAGDATGTAANNAGFYLDQYNGSAQVRRLTLAGNGDLSVTAAAFKPGGGSWSAPSDARLKQDIEPLSGALARMLQLKGVSFEYREPDPARRPAGRHIGFLAQQVQPLFPSWVGTDDQGFLTVGSQGFEALTVEALRELRAEKDAALAKLEAEYSALRDDLASLREQQSRELGALQQQLTDLRALLAPAVADGGR
ncbi:MAG: tail fiber domain-containing protein [Rhodanobacteraceae bacterium]|nr:tail fiber domain-containing protein [Rhodanobacteraceae bacterium]